jgi:ribosomal protein S27AE
LRNAALAYEQEEKRNAADFNSLAGMGLSRGADMIIEVDSLLAKCPRCGAWPMAANFLKGGSPQQKIRFQCAKCRYVGGGHLRRSPAVQRASENAQG